MSVYHHRGYLIYPQQPVTRPPVYLIENSDTGELVVKHGSRRVLNSVTEAEHYIDDVLT
jgi:hypothetical protein